MTVDDATSGRLGKVGARDHDVNSRTYRTELLAEPGGEWSLLVDGRFVASTLEDGVEDTDPLDNAAAHAWAQRQLGEGTHFLPVLVDDAAEAQIARGERIDWVASPAGFNDRDAAADQVTARRLDDLARRLADTVTTEAPERDPDLARLQEARDWSAARGEFELADSQNRLLDMVRAQKREERAHDDVVVPPPRQRVRELDD